MIAGFFFFLLSIFLFVKGGSLSGLVFGPKSATVHQQELDTAEREFKQQRLMRLASITRVAARDP